MRMLRPQWLQEGPIRIPAPLVADDSDPIRQCHRRHPILSQHNVRPLAAIENKHTAIDGARVPTRRHGTVDEGVVPGLVVEREGVADTHPRHSAARPVVKTA